MVNGATVNIASSSAARTTTEKSINKHTVGSTANYLYQSNSGVSTVTGENRSPTYTDTGSTASPTTQMVHQTTVSSLSESTWVDEEMNSEGDYEEEEVEGEGGYRVTRGINSSPQWKWNGKRVEKGKRDWGEISFEMRGATLSLSSVRPTDSGNYTCHHRGKERFSFKVIVAGGSHEVIKVENTVVISVSLI